MQIYNVIPLPTRRKKLIPQEVDLMKLAGQEKATVTVLEQSSVIAADWAD
jgi:hypothetical protein